MIQLRGKGRVPVPAKVRDPLVKRLFDHIDHHPTLTRKEVFERAGYEPTMATKYAHGQNAMRVSMLRDLAQSSGLALALMEIE